MLFRSGYHALTQGFLCGEILRRITGKTVGAFLQEEFAEPLGLDFFIGVPDDRLGDVATMIFPEQEEPISDFFLSVESDPEGIQSKIFTNDGGHMDEFQSELALKSEIPAAGGVATAIALAKLYAPFACKGEINGIRFADNSQQFALAQLYQFKGKANDPFNPNAGKHRHICGYLLRLATVATPALPGIFAF